MGRLAGLFQPLDFVNHTKQKQQELLQLRQVKRTSQDSTNELIIWKMNPLVAPVTSVKFRLAFVHA